MFEGYKANKVINGLAAELEYLDKALTTVEGIQDPLDKLVTFFNIMAPWFDKETREHNIRSVIEAVKTANKSGLYNQKLEALESLEAHVLNAGRSSSGLNRTAPGETVTADKVYLGDVMGRWTFTVPEWKASFNKVSQKQDASADELADQPIIEGQARGFVNSHIAPMHQLIQSLKR